MSVTETSEVAAQAEALNEKLKELLKGNWLHQFEIDGERRIVTRESFAYRRRVLTSVFNSLLVGRSVLALDEASGLYPALLHRAGAGSVTASSGNQRSCDLIAEVSGVLGVPTAIVKSKLLAFYEGEPYVDVDHGASHEFMLALGHLWPLFGASGESFDAIVEACAFFVTDGVIFDWTDAAWATPPPPPEWNVDGFVDALRRKFEYVCRYSDWLVVAVGKLPAEEVDTFVPPVRDPDALAAEPPTEQDLAASRFQAAVTGAVPKGATVLVVSKGDASLTHLEGRTAWHFPQSEDGAYLGYHPADSGTAIEHLEMLRARGAGYLAIPEPSLWWLEHYDGLSRHLEENHSRLPMADEEACAIFDLSGGLR